MADKVNITVRRNWKKKIKALTDDVKSFTSYSLSSNFEGIEVPTDDMYSFVQKELSQMFRTRFSYNKETGACCLHVHSNLWFQWTKKIDW